MKLLIITNSFNRDKSLVERSLSHSLKLQDQVEGVYFIDQNKEPLSLEDSIKNNSKLNVFQHHVTCVSKARNSVEVPESIDWIIFCDDDGYIDSNYISVFKDLISKQPELEIVAGSIKRDDNGDYYSPRHKIGGSLSSFRNSKLLMGSNFCVKANVFKELAKFDEDFGAGGYWGSGEETDFCWAAYFSNIKMEYCRELVVFHIPPYASDLSNNMKKAYKYGVGKGALVMKWLLKGKMKVIYELLEMYVVPFVQIIKSLITFRWNLFPVYLSSLLGRSVGLVRGLFYYLGRS